MTTGALIFAQNNGIIDYVELARFAAKRVQQYLSIPVTLVTDDSLVVAGSEFDQVIVILDDDSHYQKRFSDGSTQVTAAWKNHTRHAAYNTSPYDTTLVLDSDYILCSNTLAPALLRSCDLQIYRKSFPVNYWQDNSEFNRISQFSIPFFWATTFIFQKNERMQAFFDLVSFIKENWVYFKQLYNVYSRLYRNDYAFSIAIHLMNCKTTGNFAVELPGKMNFIRDTDCLTAISGNSMQFLLQKERKINEFFPALVSGLDMHVMNKASLGRVIRDV